MLRNLLFVSVIVLFAPLAAQAIPIDYSVIYTADAGGGPDGAGSFTYDADTLTLSSLLWSFDDGLSGAYAASPGPFDDFLARVLIGTCLGCGSLRPSTSDFDTAYWQTSLAGISTYLFTTPSEATYFGTFSTSTVSTVPEPGTLALFGIGLLGLGAARRRKKA